MYYLSWCNEPGLVLGRLSCRGNFVTLDLFLLSHLCGWRKRGKEEEEEGESSGGEGRAAQVVRGDWRDE